jgi:hypothetical protein
MAAVLDGENLVPKVSPEMPPPAEYSVSLQQIGSESGTLYFSAVDHGCPINTTLTVITGYKYYLQNRAGVSCPFTANLSRVVVFGAMLQSQKLEWLTNFSAISCIPQYTGRPGTLEVTLRVRRCLGVRKWGQQGCGMSGRLWA